MTLAPSGGSEACGIAAMASLFDFLFIIRRLQQDGSNSVVLEIRGRPRGPARSRLSSSAFESTTRWRRKRAERILTIHPARKLADHALKKSQMTSRGFQFVMSVKLGQFNDPQYSFIADVVDNKADHQTNQKFAHDVLLKK
jgi:hypothetical protein